MAEPPNLLAAQTAHAEIRNRILSGRLPGGTVISQVGMASELGISRTPLREALRMLQEEGLVEAEPNRRCRVTSFDARDLDAIYGARMVLEALGMRLTLPRIPAAALSRAGDLLDELDRLGGPDSGEAWHRHHHDFHETFVAGASAPLIEQIHSQAKLSERYMVLEAGAREADGSGRAAEHRAVLRHACAGEVQDAIVTTARHLARTPLLILAETASEFEPAAIRAALSMIIDMSGDHDMVRRSRRSVDP